MDRMAVLIDADNTSAKYAVELLDELARTYTVTVKRAYGDWTTTQLGSWKTRLNDLAIQPMQQFSYTVGKNATDSALIIDAMDLLYAGNVEAFAIVSSDSDFTRLATRLRESGHTVVGMGRRKTPSPFVAACDRFIYLEVLTTTSEGSGDDTHEGEDQVPDLPDLKALLTRAINASSAEDGWAWLSTLGSYLNKTMTSFDSRNYGFNKLSDLLKQQNFVDVEGEGAKLRVRLRSSRPPRKSTAK